MMGKPAIKGTSSPVQMIVHSLAAEESFENICRLTQDLKKIFSCCPGFCCRGIKRRKDLSCCFMKSLANEGGNTSLADGLRESGDSILKEPPGVQIRPHFQVLDGLRGIAAFGCPVSLYGMDIYQSRSKLHWPRFPCGGLLFLSFRICNRLCV